VLEADSHFTSTYNNDPASFRETCQWLKFPLNRLRAQSKISPAVGLLPSALPLEEVNLFNYLGNMIYYEGELDIDNKLNNFFLKITGILNNVFRPQKKPLRKQE